jgi:hypothetical protein
MPCVQITIYDARDAFELLTFHDRSSCPTILSNWKHSILDDSEEPESEPKKGTIMLMNLTEGLRLIKAGIKASEKLIQMSSEEQ